MGKVHRHAKIKEGQPVHVPRQRHQRHQRSSSVEPSKFEPDPKFMLNDDNRKATCIENMIRQLLQILSYEIGEAAYDLERYAAVDWKNFLWDSKKPRGPEWKPRLHSTAFDFHDETNDNIAVGVATLSEAIADLKSDNKLLLEAMADLKKDNKLLGTDLASLRIESRTANEMHTKQTEGLKAPVSRPANPCAGWPLPSRCMEVKEAKPVTPRPVNPSSLWPLPSGRMDVDEAKLAAPKMIPVWATISATSGAESRKRSSDEVCGSESIKNPLDKVRRA